MENFYTLKHCNKFKNNKLDLVILSIANMK